MDAKHLESLLICHGLPTTCLDLLTETEQWKNLKKIGFGEVENPNIDSFLHLEKIRFEARKMSPEDVWKLVQRFQKPLPTGSYFDITVNHDADVDDILTYFRKKGVDVRSNPVRPGDNERYIHTQRFVIPKTKEDHVLIVRMNNSRVYGWVGKASRFN
uniref:FTH domain-containing protein n=1 Tax=Caenorhabditis tropicalis TaxID=1561998 RepID=A0A1I7V250_9PELO